MERRALTEEDWERIERFASTRRRDRSPMDLTPEGDD